MENTHNLGDLDAIDRKILNVVSEDGRISVTALAARVGLSKSPAQVRLKRLQDEGYILGFHAQLNMTKLGLEHVAFAEVKLTSTTEVALTAFNEAVSAIPEVEQCHMIASDYDYLLKVRTCDISSYRRVLGDVISTLPWVSSTSTFVSMQTVKESAPTPTRNTESPSQ
ncbi:MAG: Lrp/AsnC family transcriptional regulator [Pseudomonadota bacterium]